MSEPTPSPSAPPPSPVAQAAQNVSTRDVREGVILSRLDGKKDIVPVEFPPVPARLAIYNAFRQAVGWREGDEDEPSGEFNGDDASAVLWAALGLCWRGKDAGLPHFRDMGRDVVAYGEVVMTQLLFAGYGPIKDQTVAGQALMETFMEEVWSATRRADAGFQKAKGRK